MLRAADGQPRFFHGTEFDDAKRICREGFRVAHLQRETFTEETPWGWTHEYTEEWLRISTGNLGTGIYVSTEPAYAWTYGDTLLEVAITPGTRILDISIEPDRAVLAYLKREFGKEIGRAHV